MNYRPPNNKTILIYLVVGLLILAAAFAFLGGAGWFRVLRVLLIYGGVFLFILYVFRTVRRR